MIDDKKLWRISSSLTFIQGFVKNKRRKNKDRWLGRKFKKKMISLFGFLFVVRLCLNQLGPMIVLGDDSRVFCTVLLSAVNYSIMCRVSVFAIVVLFDKLSQPTNQQKSTNDERKNSETSDFFGFFFFFSLSSVNSWLLLLLFGVPFFEQKSIAFPPPIFRVSDVLFFFLFFFLFFLFLFWFVICVIEIFLPLGWFALQSLFVCLFFSSLWKGLQFVLQILY